MIQSLLKTKRFIPRLPANHILRPRLLEILDQGLTGKVILVSAPAGFGKTTLIASWLQTRNYSASWLTLDDGDNDPARFLSYLSAALGDLLAKLNQPVIESDPPARALEIEPFLDALINQVADLTGEDEHILIVLDDYHVIRSAKIHRAMDYLLDHAPPTLILVICTRQDPPLPLGRLRGRGQLTELRLMHIRFTEEESAGYLSGISKQLLTAKDIERLIHKTDGWISSLQMAATTLQNSEDPVTFVRNFTGSNRHILDYLIEEVLSRQEDEIQSFLLKTSHLDQMTAELCDAVLESSHSQRILEYLEATNLFIIPLDERREWYRYHHLFSDLLASRLERTQPELVSELNKRASEWYERQGLVELAIGYALKAGEYDRAAGLIDATAGELLMRSEILTVINWIDRVPEEIVINKAGLCLHLAVALLLAGRPQDEVVKRLRDSAAVDSLDRYKAERIAVKALLAVLQGKVEEGADLSAQALATLPEDSIFLRSILANNLGITLLYKGDVDAAIKVFEKAVVSGQVMGSVISSAGALSNVAGLFLNQGQIQRAETLYRRALEIATDSSGRRLPIAGKALFGLAEIARERNELAKAETLATEAIEQFRQYGQIGNVFAYLGLARIKQSQGESRQALELALKAREMAIAFDASRLDDTLVDVTLALIDLERGQVESAQNWLESEGFTIEGLAVDDSAKFPQGSVDTLIRESLRHIGARIHILRGEADKALVLLDLLLTSAREGKRKRYVLRYLVLKSIALQQAGHLESALRTLEEALSLAEPGGFVSVFIDEGKPVAKLLGDLAANEGLSHFGKELLATFRFAHTEGRATDRTPGGTQLVEALSEREIQVLNLIADGLTNKEIASRLVISLSTVKGHTSNIYGKLGVANRTQAIAVARSLGLLKP